MCGRLDCRVETQSETLPKVAHSFPTDWASRRWCRDPGKSAFPYPVQLIRFTPTDIADGKIKRMEYVAKYGIPVHFNDFSAWWYRQVALPVPASVIHRNQVKVAMREHPLFAFLLWALSIKYDVSLGLFIPTSTEDFWMRELMSDG